MPSGLRLWPDELLPLMFERGMFISGNPGVAPTGERDVVCITGDGAAGFNIMEMQSAAREGLAITTIVFAEGSWTMEEPNELELYGKTFGTAQGEIRWDLVGQGLGCHAEYVDKIEALEPALRRAQQHDGPSLVCLRSDHDANLAVPEAMMKRFFEVYFGPSPVEQPVGA